MPNLPPWPRPKRREIEAEDPDEGEDEKAAHAGPEEAVVKSESGSNHKGEEPRLARRVFRGVDQAEVLCEQDIAGDPDEEGENDGPEEDWV